MPSRDRVMAPIAARFVGVEHQPGAHGAGPLGEQLRRRVAEHLPWRGALRRRLQRADGDLHLVGDGERLAAGGEHGDAGAAAEDVVDEAGGGVHDVLAVVDQQQHPAPGQEGDEPLADVAVATAPSIGTPRASATATGTWSGLLTDASRTPNAPSG